MGQEIACRARLGSGTDEGKVYLESDHVLFRGTSRVKIPLAEVTKVTARNGWLELRSGKTTVSFELGSRAERWAERITHPPSRLDKLGVKVGSCVSVHTGLSDAFCDELIGAGADVSRRMRKNSNLIFLVASSHHELRRIASSRSYLDPAGAIWVIYPKGRKELTENDVLAAGRAAGLTDTKVVSFSTTETALRFVIPVAQRLSAGKTV